MSSKFNNPAGFDEKHKLQDKDILTDEKDQKKKAEEQENLDGAQE